MAKIQVGLIAHRDENGDFLPSVSICCDIPEEEQKAEPVEELVDESQTEPESNYKTEYSPIDSFAEYIAGRIDKYKKDLRKIESKKKKHPAAARQ